MFRSPEAVQRTVEEQFGRRRVLVVGDLMLDVYLWGEVGRISPEAPVPIVRLSRRKETAGGAGNVLLNLAALGIRASAAGFVGDDEPGRRLLALLDEAGISTASITTCAARPTVSKTRIIGSHQQMLRIDEEVSKPADASDVDRLLDSVHRELATGVEAVVLSDYGKGALPDRVCRSVIDEGKRRNIPVLVDPKGRDFRKYAGATALTPNRHEFDVVVGGEGFDEPTFRDAAHRLRADLDLRYLIVTRSEKGVSVFEEEGDEDFPAVAREVFDVSGAGDTMIATLTAAMVAGHDVDDALRLANMAAGVVVGKVGTAPIHRDELLGEILEDPLAALSSKVSNLENLLHRVAEWRSKGEKVVFTNGCFDLLHVGHVTLLAKARREGNRLIVGVNTDRSVRALKGPERPIVTENDRALVLAGLASVDAVILFDEDTPLRLIEAIRPEVLVKGSDYAETEVVGADVVKANGGKVVLVRLVEGRSTTRMISRQKS
jgi:D-beta-D-heptose 7-phosphate kinase / D-beta-D-heptose 1-phosphate adenosyltransferase